MFSRESSVSPSPEADAETAEFNPYDSPAPLADPETADFSVSSNPQADAETELCIVCQDAARATRFYDCGHSHACTLCTLKLIECAGAGRRAVTCPTCKEEVLRIKGWDPLQSPSQPVFVRGETSDGVGVEQFIAAHSDDPAYKEAAAAARKACAQPRAPARHAMERDHEVQTRELAGCWVNVCPAAPVLPCALYRVRTDGGDVLRLDALVCCLGVCAFGASGKYRRDSHFDELLYTRMDEGLSANSFVVKSRRRMLSDVGGYVYKMC